MEISENSSAQDSVTPKHSISRRLLKIVLSIYFVLTLIVTITQIYIEYDSAKKDIKAELVVVKETFEDILATNVWSLDFEQLKITISGINRLPLVTNVEIRDENKQLVKTAGVAITPEVQDSPGLFWHDFPLLIQHGNETRQIGSVKIYSNNQVVFDRIKVGIIVLILTAILKTSVLIFLIIIVFNRLLTKPLGQLASDAKKIDINQHHFRPVRADSGDSRDELHVLENALNIMMDKISVSINELEDLNTNLESKVKERTYELDQERLKLQSSLKEVRSMQKQLIESEKMAALGAIVTGVAHEINTPLGVCVTAISNLEKLLSNINNSYEKGELSAGQFQGFLTNSNETSELIISNLQKASELVNNFKLISVDQSSEKRVLFCIREHIEQTISTLPKHLQRHQITINVEGENNLQIHSFPRAWSQIIHNLVINSLTHAYDEHVPENKGNICIRLNKVQSQFQFIYEDDGIGISDTIREKVFDPFFTTKRGIGGPGLGLNIIYNLVTQKMRGNIGFESSPQSGTRFIITVPMDTQN